ncbi:hypothetical protein SAMN05421776_12138 [Nocardia farcinica]|uniref:Uncharacterized protein n=1 Tax=Nocardia farcinica TaxID=37329 RepID=A0A0H5P967_NOCFR|nr:hypothetical protein [Nocardia farcinica]AXK88563.1 hypothetical protein DXT66_25730 [Nocardia farcinica]PFW98867.1 hypothetical protein CJ469_05828 [Nocardia farcinica]PFX04473.1 hypothetical protein CJ468_05449 [Nocardia farcinica]CRY84252.1 Uncharacterised protein [Nocardia farcinica]SIT34092.1 hypothetical protein SAMN05421776_12138 [Nocardia farcinica]
MTLHTRVAIVQKIDPKAAFQLALSAICTAAGEEHRIETAKVNEPEDYGRDGVLCIGTVIGQGLPGIVECDFRTGGPLYAEDYYGNDEDTEPDDTRWLCTPACWLEIGWDTGYGYRSPEGLGCSALHARAITFMHKALSEMGIEMRWYNEFDARWHPGIENLDTLSAAGLEADLWFRTTALPAINSLISQYMREV